MAVRRVLLVIGDLSAAGQIPVAALTNIDADYADEQDDFAIWNTQNQAWELLVPGDNSNTTFTANDYWGLESRLRAGVEDTFAPGTVLYCIKHTPDSTSLDWLTGTAGDDLITEVTAAASAAAGVGDTLSIDGVVIGVLTDDFLSTSWRNYGSTIQGLITSLRTRLEAVADCTMGTVRDDGELTPVVVIEPHYGFASGLTVDQKGQLAHCRMQIQGLENEDNRVTVLRSQRYTSYTDNETFDAQSMVNMGADVGERLWPLIIDEDSNPVARLVSIFGDSTAEGWGTNNNDLPTHQKSALTGAKIWQFDSGDFEDTLAGTNNQVSVSASLGHGFEVNLGDLMRNQGDVWIVKGTQVGSFAGDFRGLLDAATPPTEQRDIVSWSLGRGQLQDLHVRGSMISSIERLRELGYKPELDLVVISLGSYDALNAAADADQTVSEIRSLMANVKKICTERSVAIANLKFVVMVPPAYAEYGAIPYDTVDTVDLNLIREGLLALPVTEQDVHVVDLSDHEAATDSFHQSTAGVKTASDAIFAAWRSTSASAVEPLFSPTKVHMLSALRLSKLDPENDAVDIIDNSILTVRGALYRELGESRISSLRNIAFNRDPVTADEYLRVMAADTEIKMVRAQLIRVMPMLFMDGAGFGQTWNEEAAFRESSYLQTKDELRRLDSEVRASLQVLLTSDLSNYSSSDSEAFGGEDNSAPGDTVFGSF